MWNCSEQVSKPSFLYVTLQLMESRAIMASALTAAALVLAAVGPAAAADVDKQCFNTCFDQCVPRNEFWFCQFSCYVKCGPAPAARRGGGGGDADCEQSCVQSICRHLDPDSKMMVACRDTCRKNYASAGCNNGDN